MPIDPRWDETGEGRVVVMYTVGSKGGAWTVLEKRVQKGSFAFFPGTGGRCF